MALSEEEKETVIQFDESRDSAILYTASRNVARTVRRAGYRPIKKTRDSWWFEIPIDAMSIRGEKLTKAARGG
jgi:hypothetical protein